MIQNKVDINSYIEFKKKRLARLAVHVALKKNMLVREAHCQICKNECKTNAHHIDYGRPLNIMWLCFACHGIVHTRKHPLNPKNNQQTPNSLIWNSSDTITVSFNIPIKQYMLLKEKSLKSKKKLSRILREDVEKIYPIQSDQLEFNFEEVANDKAQSKLQQRIQSMDKDENDMLQQKRSRISFVRGERDYGMSGVGKQFFEVSRRHGENAGRL